MPDHYELTEEAKAENTVISADQLSSGITGNIRDAIRSYAPKAYDGYFERINKAKNEKIPLHHSFGSENAMLGRVISFNVAGSSFSEPLRYEEGLAGKSNLLLDDGRKLRKGKKDHVYRYSTQGSGEKLDGSQLKAYADKRLDEVYGEGGALGHDHIRKKESPDGRKVKYSISGPRIAKLGIASGWFDVGTYKIANTREYVYSLGKQQLETLFRDPVFRHSKEPILFTFTGHSRGGVGVIEGAMKLKYLIQQKYPQYIDRIRFETLLYDPVPGPESRLTSSVNHAINLKEQTEEMRKAGMAPLDSRDHTTVMYSMGCNHKNFFTPMKVMGADTVILTGHSHDAGLKNLEKQENLIHRKAYLNAQNGEAYRASGLCKMPSGVYIADENNVMVQAKDMGMVECVIDKVYTRSDKENNDRIRRIAEVCSDVKAREGATPSLESIIRGFNAHDPFYVRSSKEFAEMRKRFDALQRLIKSGNADVNAMLREQREMKQWALAYIAKKDGAGPHSNRTQGRIAVARNLVRYLDHDRELSLKWYSEHPLDDSPKTDDIRQGYLTNVRSSLEQNQEYMSGICQKYRNKQPIEADIFQSTLCSMLADRYFLTHQQVFMPDPLTNSVEQPDSLKTLDNLLGSGSDSLYLTFTKSKTVRRFVSDMLKGGDALNVFSNSADSVRCLDSLLKSVQMEIKQAVASETQSADIPDKKPVIANPVK